MNREGLIDEVAHIINQNGSDNETVEHRAERIVNLVEAYLPPSHDDDIRLRGHIAKSKEVPLDPTKAIKITVEFANTLENAHTLMDMDATVHVSGAQLRIPDTPAEDDADPADHPDQTRLDEPEPEDDGLDDYLNEDDLV